MAVRRWTWVTDTAPFSQLDDVQVPASFVVEQITDKEFRIPSGLGFQYNPSHDGAVVRVTPESLPTTDFASIPRYMAWFVSRHGRHTPAAFVHDQLVTPGMPFEDRVRADRAFLAMMDTLEVPPVQSRVMWTAVTLATRLTGPAHARLGMALWFVLALLGTGGLGWALVTGRPWLAAAALLAPPVAAVLWGRQYAAGVIAGYALPVVVLPAGASFVGYSVYLVIEQSVKHIRQFLPRNKGETLPSPIGYQGR